MKIGAIDLFCGVGGLTYGLQKAGIKVVAGIDNDISCDYAYSHNNNALFIGKRIEIVTSKEVMDLLNGYDVKVLVGCAPCQPFSRHQKDKQNRSNHKNWRLLYQFSRLVRELNPQIVSMENVPQLRDEEVFQDFLNMLKERHYFVDYKVVKAADYGVPQRRRRLILLASVLKPIKIIEKTHTEHITVRDAIYDLPEIGAGEANSEDRLHVTNSLSEKNTNRIKHSVPNGTWRDWPEELILDCHKSKTGNTYPSVYGRMSWDKISPTITTQFTCYGTGRFGHPSQDRALTLREGAILQAFPRNYSFAPEKSRILIKVIARQIGNALPPRLGEIIGISILQHLNF